ncbi:MAG: PilZ domain-containing protein [Burkholderiales bacterium]|nr:PilZ domain-containing protein [Burkholderiales bacterium]
MLRLTAHFKDRLSLAHAYMPFIEGGALFVASTEQAQLGDAAFVFVSLEEGGQKFPVTGRVVWLGPLTEGGETPPGLGIQLGPEPSARQLMVCIEASLGNIQSSLKKTATL